MSNVAFVPGQQIRTAEPFQTIYATGIRIISTGFDEANNCVLSWLRKPPFEKVGDKLRIYPFVAIVDHTFILVGKLDDLTSYQETSLADTSKTNYVYLKYEWKQSKTVDPAKIIISTESIEDALFLGSVKPDGSIDVVDDISFATHAQTYFNFDNFDESVEDGMIVYLDKSGKAYPATSKDKDRIVGLADLKHKRIITSGIVKTNLTADPGSYVYLSESGKLTTSKTSVVVGLLLNDGYLLLGTFTSSRGSAILIETPSIVQPKDGETDFSGTIKSSAYKPTDLFYGEHEASDWEIASDSKFKNIVESSYDDKTNLTSYQPQHLDPDTTYYVRVRYKSDNHNSEWSNSVKFTTASAYIETPTLSTSDTGTLYPTFKLTPFKAHGYSDNWKSTDWQIATDPKFNNLVLDYTETDPSKQDTLTINNDILDVDSTYYVRAKYNGDQGHSSNWSNVLEYNTDKYQIEYTIPSQENELSTVEGDVTHDGGRAFDITKYILKGTVTHGTLTITGMHFSWNLPEVDKDTKATITLWVTRNSDSKIVTDKSSKQLTIKDVSLVSDSAVSVSNFKDNTEYNDGWDLDA